MAEFLPICDVLFNVISLAGYFCDVVFDVVMGYALLDRGYFRCFSAVLIFVGGSLILSQVISLRWYFRTSVSNKLSTSANSKSDHHYIVLCAIVVVHCLQLGVLWRYAKLFIPVDLRNVKHEVRDLCMLRIQHGFCQAAPMLLLQLYLMSERMIVQSGALSTQSDVAFSDMNTVAASLSLFSVCWALASFSKNVRLQNVHRLVLTWLGVIFQFLWRLGTVCSRVTALTVYATLYAHWVFLVIGLHWTSMFLWLISPRNVFHGERISKLRKCMIAALISFVYVFAYVNLQEVNHRRKMVTFYVVMFLENTLLVSMWLVGVWQERPQNWYMVPILVIGSFVTGLLFMFLYYRFFHVRRLGYEAGGRPPSAKSELCRDPDNCSASACKCKRNNNSHRTCDELEDPNDPQAPPNVPGVFNCRFSNPVGNGTKRKKKKPTSFVPPPSAVGRISPSPAAGPEPIPFWRKPLPTAAAAAGVAPSSHALRHAAGGSSENDGTNSSVGSRVNIHQKLQEKKQKQLAELKIIEEEIRQGKLGGPAGNKSSAVADDDNLTPLPRQPIPVSKKHNNLQPVVWASPSPELQKGFDNLGDLTNDVCMNYQGQDMANYRLMNTSTMLYNGGVYEFGKRSNQGDASPVSQISATESNSLTQETLSHIHAPLDYSYAENVQAYAEDSSRLHPEMVNFADSVFARDQTSRFANNKKSHSPMSVQSHSPKPTNSELKKIAERRRANLSYDENIHDMAYASTQNKNGMHQYGQSDMSNGFAYNVIPPPKTKLERPSLDQQKRSQTPEILLSPHYLNSAASYVCQREPNYRIIFDNPPLVTLNENEHASHISKQDSNPDRHGIICNEDGDVYEIENSDIDSQISLPRSYTLPREFKYYKKNRGRKPRNEHVVISTNSSDGDVDSGDDNDLAHRPNQLFNNAKALQVAPSVQNKPDRHFLPVSKHHHIIVPQYKQEDDRFNMCHDSNVNNIYERAHNNYTPPALLGSIGRELLNKDHSTALLSNSTVINGLSSPNNLLNSEVPLSMRQMRSRHFCNGPRHETRL